MYLKKYENHAAKELMKTYSKFQTLNENPFIKEWINEADYNVQLYVLYGDDDDIKSLATLTTMKKDPLGIHLEPRQLQYIYTFDENRRKGYATFLLQELKTMEQSTAFVTDDIVKNLFIKAGYLFHAFDDMYAFPIYRFP